MVRVERVPEPEVFDEQVRRPGNEWLRSNPTASRPRDYWSPFRPYLAEGFGQRCGYCAMFVPIGTVDHFISCRTDPDLAYEWSNYRFADHWINNCKRTLDDSVLDPYEVEDDWFEILLPSLQLIVTDRVPPAQRKRAEATLRRLNLRDHEIMIRWRQAWYALFLDGKLSLEGLDEQAPLIARAVRKQGLVG